MVEVVDPKADSRRWTLVLALFAVPLIFLAGLCTPLPGVTLDAVYPTYLSPWLLDGSPVHRLSIFALGLLPFFTPLAFLEVVKLLFPAFGRWQVASARNMFRLSDCVRIAALLLAAAQGYGVASAITQGNGLVGDMQGGFVFTGVVTYVCATALLGWLADRITFHSPGSGFWLLWTVPALASLARTVLQLFELLRTGFVTPVVVLMAGLFVLASCMAIVLLNLALIDIPLAQSPPDSGLDKALQARLASMAIIWPPLLANVILGATLELMSLFAPEGLGNFAWLHRGTFQHAILDAALIMLFSYAYSRRPYASWQVAKNAASGETVPARRQPVPFWLPGLVLIAVCNGGEVLDRALALPFLTGSSLTVVTVTVAMSFVRGWRLGVHSAVGAR